MHIHRGMQRPQAGCLPDYNVLRQDVCLIRLTPFLSMPGQRGETHAYLRVGSRYLQAECLPDQAADLAKHACERCRSFRICPAFNLYPHRSHHRERYQFEASGPINDGQHEQNVVFTSILLTSNTQATLTVGRRDDFKSFGASNLKYARTDIEKMTEQQQRHT